MLQKLKQRYYWLLSGTVILLLFYVNRRELIDSLGIEQRPEKAMTSNILIVNTMEYQGIGNQMFEAAAIIGTNQRKDKRYVLCIPTENRISDVFNHDLCTWKANYLKNAEGFSEKSFGTYDNRTLFITTEKDVIFHGYFQSWKYFSGEEKAVREHFKFHKWITKSAETFLVNSIKQHVDLIKGSVVTNGLLEGHTLIGIHIRRGDMVLASSGSSGYAVAPIEYVHRAIIYMEKKYPNSFFIICSDDLSYCRNNIDHPKAIFVNTRDDKVDLAVLSMCKHSIITVGTYGWWSAWLANGTTVYYKNFLVKGSELAKAANPSDYFPPHWIPME